MGRGCLVGLRCKEGGRTGEVWFVSKKEGTMG